MDPGGDHQCPEEPSYQEGPTAELLFLQDRSSAGPPGVEALEEPNRIWIRELWFDGSWLEEPFRTKDSYFIDLGPNQPGAALLICDSFVLHSGSNQPSP